MHHAHGKNKRGFRTKEPSLNRAVVVLAVASWQAVMQDLVRACIDLSKPSDDGPLPPGAYGLLRGRLLDEVNNFGTPNAENTRKLLVAVGHDSWPYWTWRQAWGKAGPRTVTPAQARAQISEWLAIRHAIAHGDQSLAAKSVLEAVGGQFRFPARGHLAGSYLAADFTGCHLDSIV
ncbi:hypothetical protein [Streptomyces iconiensis]|uniref:Uncharacterized protein n=1 Tax=Streptomyces iconiensis TaxID=1384038 RepID=A0ABT7A221_9ACTN|nr:hypothetical protein [Streptomyces iconiensis]MDJ1134668.1 hypothetical protein [Streptomyces iconiensis]